MPEQEAADDDFTFPTPPQLLAVAARTCYGHHSRSRVSPSSPPPPWLQLSSPIRRSFSAADCAASPWRTPRRGRGGACCSPALSDYAAGFYDGEEEEMMDSLWEDLNDDEAAPEWGKEEDHMFLASHDVSRRRSVGGPGQPVERRRPTATTKEREPAAVLAASRSSRRRSPGLVVMMRALKKMFVAHKSRNKVHKADEQSAASASASSSSKSCKK